MAIENSNNDVILEVKNLVLSFKTDHGVLKAVRNISFDLHRGETLCIVGESGSGKSVTSKAILGILAANSIVEGGHIYYRGEDLLEVAEEEFHKIRGHKIGMIFQDPLSSLNPIVRIGQQITEATLINSNKLKLLYDDIISDDLIAYKNCLARGDHKAELLQNNYLKEKVDLTKKYDADNSKDAKAEKAARKAELNTKHKEIKAQIKQIKADTKAEAAPLKAKLKETKKQAKVKIKEYKDQVEKEYSDRVIEIKARGLAKDAEKKEIDAAKLDRINKLKITKAEAKRRALEIMKEVGIPEPEKRFRQYPFVLIAASVQKSKPFLEHHEPKAT